MKKKETTAVATAAEAALLSELRQRLEDSAQLEQLTDVVYRVVDSPLGKLLLASTGQGIVRVAFEGEEHDKVLERLSDKVGSRILRSEAKLDAAARQIHEYFNGTRRTFELPLDLRLSTDFRRRVQLELDRIGYGQTLSYAQMADRIGNPKAVRAVGSACATNPLPILLPCHRVLRTDGSLGGYLGGLEAKRQLLLLEHAQAVPAEQHLF
ncbi:methylated-DNA--[protein]-cysteine S-methyltransferase [Glutamicibacter sp. MNS18]|uniref:methylated-DNA--[protein]-cysteine S-methyltransferase n=1 Tax=Glutamicibacter sp. MNS18 TaxID=2989817 RepID=UPI002236BC74|nr:methylated-DNA--[protein]-cysteine S-methyltransferase [Glutamicibacter sp. MNS18]MCW4465958.1 methylated-DNA--[protein]-cysteine S-methyltransferase [Glutamicibacter sp. MNS18]